MKPLVSICVLAYNHGKYIQKTLDSILQQDTSFPIEVLVLEDASSDNTLEVIKAYESQFPETVKVRANTRNIGHHLNMREGFKLAQGEYVSFLDGDDYWLSTTKLEQQIQILEQDSDCVGVGHNVQLLFEDGSARQLITSDIPDTITLKSLITGETYLHTSSLTFRNIFKGQFPASYYAPEAGDWFLSILHAEHGYISYLPETLSVYRIHSKGLWSSLSPLKKKLKNIDAAAAYNILLEKKYKHLFSKYFWDTGSILKRHFWQLSTIEKVKYTALLIALFIDKSIDYYLVQKLIGEPARSLYFSLHRQKAETHL